MATSPLTTDRSQSRGRDILSSSGRGGAGNIRSMSKDALTRATEHDDDGGNPRGREFEVSPKVMSSGRGGAGNIRSPSKTRSPSAGPTKAEKELIEKHIHMDETAVHSAGRGGAGNIQNTSRSRSRDPSAAGPGVNTTNVIKLPVHSSGRGGAGNMTSEGSDGAALSRIEDAEIAKHAHTLEHTHLHSTGRGGAANITDLPTPPDSKLAPHDASYSFAHSTGRGGAGNIHKDNEHEHEGSRGRESHAHHKGPLESVMDAVRSLSRQREKGKGSPEHAAGTKGETGTAAGSDEKESGLATGPGGNLAMNAK